MNDCIEAWGNPDREYAHDPDPRKPFPNRDPRPLPDVENQSSFWSDVVRQSSRDDLRVIVDRTVKQWNGVVRECLRKQTGLRLSAETESNRVDGRNRKMRSVPVRVVSELPIRFAREVQCFTGQDIMLLLHKSKLDGVKSGAEFMMKKYEELAKIQLPCVATEDEIKNVKKFAEVLLKHIKDNDKSERILNIDEDVLGAYFFRIPEIRLYWIVIGVYSQILDLPIEALTVVVLAHELAHAYTHLGYDIDNRDWNTEEFAQSDLHLVEGLAQFYTKVICEQISQRFPAALDAFEKLLKDQSDVYKEHQNWSTKESLGHEGETIRISMLECRSKGILRREDFQHIVKRSQENFRKESGLILRTS